MVADVGSLVGTARRVGLFNPLTAGALATATTAWGPTIAAGYAASAARHPNRIAVVDDHGLLTNREIEWRACRVAGALRKTGVRRGAVVGVLCRNHRGFVEASVAVAKLGARLVMLNPSLPAGQLAEVIAAESVEVVLADHDLVPSLKPDSTEIDGNVQVISVRPDLDPSWSFPGLTRNRPLLGVSGPANRLSPILLTSGTTGVPKGTRRSIDAGGTAAAFGVIETVPFRHGDVVSLPAPLFHAWGFAQLVLASSLANTVVLRRRFDPAVVLDDIEAHGASVLAAVPVMLHRILEQITAEDASSQAVERELTGLRIVATSGSALPGDLAIRWMDRFGDGLYNLYGSTEVGQVSVATPADLRAAPETAGRALRGVQIEVLGDDDRPVGPETIGEVMVHTGAEFDGYTGGGGKRMVGKLMSTGDRGYIDGDGRLVIVGRADDMIISGGENLYPSTIERSLLRHDAVLATAVVGVDDPELGNRVRAVIVSDEPGTSALTKSIKTHLRTELAAHEVPREFVYVSELPRNAAGKVLRTKLSGARRQIPNKRRAAATPAKSSVDENAKKKNSPASKKRDPQ